MSPIANVISILTVVVGTAAGLSVGFAPACAMTFYVDNSCRQNGNGKARTCTKVQGEIGAWNSLQTAANCAGMAPGDHLQIRAGKGVYNELGPYAMISPDAANCSGTAARPIVFENYPNDNVILDGSEDIKGNSAKWTPVGNGVFLCSAGMCGTSGRWPLMAWYRIARGPEQEVYLQHSSRVCDASVPPGWMRVTAANAVCVHLRENLNPGDETVGYFRTNTLLAAGIQLHVRPGVKHWRIQRHPGGGSLTIRRFRDYGIVASSDVNVDIAIDGLDIGYVTDRCVNFDTPKPGPVQWRLLNSHLHHCGQEGVHSGVDTSADYAIEGNEIDHIQTPPHVERCGKQCSFPMDRGAAILVGVMAGSRGAIVRGNRIHDSCGGYQDGRCTGINVEGGAANLILENNLIWNLAIQAFPFGGRAFMFSMGAGCTNCIVRNNRIYNVDICFAFQDTLSYSLAIYNNTCANPWYSAIGPEYGGELGSIVITNNIFYSSTSSRGPLLSFGADSRGVVPPSNNVFYCASGCDAARYQNTTYVGSNVAKLGKGNQWGDPNISISGTAPTLNIKSPAGAAYRAGVALNPAFPDYLGTARPTSGAWDIGAHMVNSDGSANSGPAPASR